MANKTKPTLFEGLMQGLVETAAFLDGSADKSKFRVHVPESVNVKALRQELHLTQDAFADAFGFSPARVKDWEQERSAPDPAVRAYLTVIAREPRVVLEILARKVKAPVERGHDLKSVAVRPAKKKAKAETRAGA